MSKVSLSKECLTKFQKSMRVGREGLALVYLEETRDALSLRYDFCLGEIFGMVVERGAKVSIGDLKKFVVSIGVFGSDNKLGQFFKRLDVDKDGLLSAREFKQVWLPRKKELRAALEGREKRDMTKFSEYTPITQKFIKDVVRGCLILEDTDLTFAPVVSAHKGLSTKYLPLGAVRREFSGKKYQIPTFNTSELRQNVLTANKKQDLYLTTPIKPRK